MKQENNFEVKNIDLEEMNEIVEIKDDELKLVTGGGRTDLEETAEGLMTCWRH